MRRALVLLSGGLDSAVTLYLARKQGFQCTCLIFDYGQRHRKEIECARRIARAAGAAYRVVRVPFDWKGSALLDASSGVATRGYRRGSIPSTYVPARNIVFLSLAVSCAEAVGATAVFIGAHSQDYSGYPDCRPSFFNAFQRVVLRGTKTGVQGAPIAVEVPLLKKGKADIIRLGARLGVPFGLTWSCYKGGARPCGVCDSCRFRARGFMEAGLKGPREDRRGKKERRKHDDG